MKIFWQCFGIANYVVKMDMKTGHIDPGNEYFIDVTPNGQRSTDGFRNLDFDQRECHLENEVTESSIFKIYTKNNCKYECYVKLANDICKCVPWDFMHNMKISKECDIFGRTCFFNSMENLTQSPENLCNHCIQECDYIKYHREIVTQDKIIKGGLTYVNFLKNIQNGKCFGFKALCDLILDTNNTFNDQALKNAIKAMGQDTTAYRTVLEQFKDIIIVHLRFMQPNIDLINPKYTGQDRFANFGGKFGIFAQLTGASFLGLVNLCILIIKLFITFIPFPKTQ